MANKATHILVVDDDRRLRALLGKFLKEQGYYVSTAADAREARHHMEIFWFDLIVLDVMMPGETGVELTTKLRAEKSDTPILMLTAMGEIENRISGLESGADDYLCKPFEPRELVLRIEAILRRVRIEPPALEEPRHDAITLGVLRFDLTNHRLTNGDKVIQLTSAEEKILTLLAENKGIAMSRAKLADFLSRDSDKPINERSVDVQITRLRQKIEPDTKKPLYLQTLWGEGYVLKVD